jgi:membrane-associated phospholipid phosphatase
MNTDEKYLKFIISLYAFTILSFLLAHLVLGSVESVILLNSLHTPLLDKIFAGITNLGNGLVIIPFFVVLLFQHLYLSFSMLLNAALQGILVSLFKRVLFPAVLRPIAFLDPESIHRVQGVDIHRFNSFPSGHTVTIFGLCFFLSLCYKNHVLSIFLLCIALCVGLSRIYLLQHFALDVGGGALIGATCGGISYYIFEQWRKPAWMLSRLHIKIIKPQQPKFS